MKNNCIYMLLLPVAIILLVLGSPDKSLTQDKNFDSNLIPPARSKAKSLGYNPITLYTDETGHIVLTEGNLFTIGGGRFSITEGDMVVNVGYHDVNVAGTTLKNGEYGIVKNRKFEKASDRIRGGSSYLLQIALIGAGLIAFIVIAIRKNRQSSLPEDKSGGNPDSVNEKNSVENIAVEGTKEQSGSSLF